MNLRHAIEYVKRDGASQFRDRDNVWAYRWDWHADTVVMCRVIDIGRIPWKPAYFTTSDVLRDDWELFVLERVGTRFPGGE